MKNKHLLTLFFAFTTMTYAQKILDEAVHYVDIVLPSEPLEAEFSGYNFTVTTPYPENNNAVTDKAKADHEYALANHPRAIEESKIQYEKALADYDYEVEQARENFKLETEAYNQLSMVERLAAQDSKPRLNLPRKPTYYEPPVPVYRAPDLSRSIVYDREVLASSYLALDGYSKAEANAENVLSGEVVFYDFEKMESERKVEEKMVYNSKTKVREKRTTVFYLTSYKRPVYFNLKFNGSQLHDGIYGNTSAYTVHRSNNVPDMFNFEKRTIEEGLLGIKAYVCDKYCQTPIDVNASVRFVKNKKGEFDDLEEAKDFAVSGYNNFEYGVENEDLTEAINIWKEAMEESNPEDRKARINAKVTKAILLNLVEASLVLNDPNGALTYLSQMKKVKLNASEKRTVKALENTIADRKLRLTANNML